MTDDLDHTLIGLLAEAIGDCETPRTRRAMELVGDRLIDIGHPAQADWRHWSAVAKRHCINRYDDYLWIFRGAFMFFTASHVAQFGRYTGHHDAAHNSIAASLDAAHALNLSAAHA